MARRLTAFLATSMLVATPLAAQTRPAAVAAAPLSDLARAVQIPHESFTLANGLKVIVHTDRKAPVVAVSVWYDIGSKHEPAGKTGFAHLFEHLMFNGTENVPGDFFEPLQQVGATDVNGTTSYDRTNYFETVPTPALARALWLESDRMGHLLGAVTQAKLDNQRGVVQNEKRQSDNAPYGLVSYARTAALYPTAHPYGHDIIGSMEDLDRASLADVKRWFTDHYGPNNAVLVLAGDIDAKTARPMVERYFGAIPRGTETPRPIAPVPTLAAAKAEVMKDRVATTRLYRIWAIPGLNDADAVPLDIGASVLGGLASSRLDNVLVRGERVAVAASAGTESLAQGGFLQVSLDVRPGVDPALAARRLDAVIADLLRTGPTADEVSRVATQYVAGEIASLESVGGFGGKAVTLAEGQLYSNDPDFYRKTLAAYAAATPAQVKAAMGRWLNRPVYALTVEPGARPAYVEAQGQAKPPVTAPAAPVETPKGNRPSPEVGQIEDLDFPDVSRTRLSNGIEVVYAQRTATPATRLSISFDAGVAADPANRQGTHAMTVAMLDEGTTTRTATQIAEDQERLGATIATGGSLDRTDASLFVPSANLAPGLDLLADVVRNPAFDAAEIERVRGQRLAGIAAELANPNAIAQRALPPLLYGSASPYGKTSSGDPAVVAKLSRDELLAFKAAWLRPDKAKIFVVSDKPLAQITPALERSFGNWRPTGVAGTKRFGARPATAAERVVLIDRPDSPQSVILAGTLTPLTAGQEVLPLVAAADVLGTNFLSRINMNLREDKGWSYGAFGYAQQLEQAVPFLISTSVQSNQTGPSIAEVRKEVRAFLSDRPVTKAERDLSINGFTRELPGNFETSSAVLGAMQRNDLFRRPDDYYDSITDKYRALTPADFDAAARADIDPSKIVWVVVGDAKTVRPQLDSLGLPVEVITAQAAPKQ